MRLSINSKAISFFNRSIYLVYRIIIVINSVNTLRFRCVRFVNVQDYSCGPGKLLRIQRTGSKRRIFVCSSKIYYYIDCADR